MTRNAPCTLWRRLAVILYDTVLLLGVLFVASALPLFFTGGVAVKPGNPFLTTYLFLVSFMFFGWFWTHGGQTLGMRTWRVRVESIHGEGHGITWWQAMLRFLVAFVSWGALGLGFWWSLWDKEKMTWHDRYSESRLVVLPRKGE